MKRFLTIIRRKLLEYFLQRVNTRRRRVLAMRFMLAADVQAVTFERNGCVWSLRPQDDDIGFSIFVEGSYHAAQIQALLDWIHRSKVLVGSRNVLIDAGANIGSTCIPFVRQTGCRALAIEPVGENVSFLRSNVEANGLAARIRVVNQAVSQSPGTLRMYLTEGRCGGNFVVRDGAVEAPEYKCRGYEEVGADTLTGIIATAGLNIEEIAMVWADVQGCELDVIQTGQPLWEQGVPLWAEVEPISLHRQGTLEIFATAAAIHFDRFIVSNDLIQLGEKAIPRPIEDLARLIQGITPAQENVDVLFLPRGFATPRSD